MNYVNPLSKISGLVAERIDQGVDFSGSGPILAIGKAKILETGGSGWPGGPYMSYQLLDGPDAGRTVYVAENIRPTVHAGQTVNAGDTIATMFQGGTGIEMGWADIGGTSPLSQTAAAGSITGANLPPGGTQVGRSFEALLNSLGVPKGNNLSAAPGGKLPSGLQSGLGAINNPTPAGAGGGILSIPSEITGFFSDANKFVTLLMWLAQPSSWLRIGAFLVGIGLLLFAIHALIAAANGEPLVKMPQSIPVPVPI
jgi:hypothetical protein